MPQLSCQVLLNQPRGNEGTQNPSFLHEPLKASDVILALSLITDERVKEPSQETVTIESPAVVVSIANKEVLAKAIDLTHENKDDFQVITDLSLLRSPKVQADKRDINRIHKAISAETEYSKRTCCEVWEENPNPKD